MPLRNWWERGGTPIIAGQAEIVTADIAALNVTSEKLSVNAVARSLVISTPAVSASIGSTAIGSTDFVLFHANVPMVIQRVSMLAQTTFFNPSNGNVVVVGNNCSTMALWNTATTQLESGSWTNMGTLSNVSVAACSDIRFAIKMGSSGAAALSIQLDYVTSQ